MAAPTVVTENYRVSDDLMSLSDIESIGGLIPDDLLQENNDWPHAHLAFTPLLWASHELSPPDELALGLEDPKGLKKWRDGSPVPRDRQLRAWLASVCTKVGFPMEKTMPMMLRICKALRQSQRAGPQQDADRDEAATGVYETLCDLSELMCLPDESVMKSCVTGALDQLHRTVCK